MNTFLIIDGYSILFRSFFSLDQTLVTKNGTPVNAVYGFFNFLLRAQKQLNPSHICVALDSGSPSFRKQSYVEYKANRSECPDLLKPQFAILREGLKSFNCNFLEQAGLEADDIIANLTAEFSQEAKIIIHSADKDLAQLVGENVQIFDNIKPKFTSEADVIAKFGIHPKFIADYLALTGDASDNIPGGKNIGEVAAKKIITALGSIEDVFHAIDTGTASSVINDKYVRLLQDSRENILLSKSLTTLKTDFNLGCKLEDFTLQHFGNDNARQFLTNYEMFSVIDRLPSLKINIDQGTLF